MVFALINVFIYIVLTLSISTVNKTFIAIKIVKFILLLIIDLALDEFDFLKYC